MGKQKQKPLISPQNSFSTHYYSDSEERVALYEEKPDWGTLKFNLQKRFFRQFQDCPPNHPWREGYEARPRDPNPYNVSTYEFYMWIAGHRAKKEEKRIG